MTEKTNPVLVEALGRAAAEPAGLPLYASKGKPGLFATSAAAKLLAQRCKDQGLLRVLRKEARGKTSQEICALSEQGLSFLLDQTSPRHVLEKLLHSLDARQAQLTDLIANTQQAQTSLEALKAIAAKILEQTRHPQPANGHAARNGYAPATANSAALSDRILTLVRNLCGAAVLEDCPLPKLYRAVQKESPPLTIGQFHDLLRRLHEQQQLYLHPWTGPLHELPEPALALLIGHVIAYYASPCP